MNEDRKRILGLLAEGKITADEAERLIAALERRAPTAAASAPNGPGRIRPKYLRVEVDADGRRGGPAKVNVRVPMNLLRAGVRLGALVPPTARDQIDAALAAKGLAFDLNTIRPENLDALVDQLGDLSVDLQHDRATVRITCE